MNALNTGSGTIFSAANGPSARAFDALLEAGFQPGAPGSAPAGREGEKVHGPSRVPFTVIHRA
jgi:hypothetical protein